MKATRIKNLFFSTAVAGMLAVGLTALPASARGQYTSHNQGTTQQQAGWSNQNVYNTTANTNNGWTKQGSHGSGTNYNSNYNNTGWSAPVQAMSCGSTPA